MQMKKLNVLLLLILIAFNSCRDKRTFNGVANQRYLTLKNQFDSTLVNHFPAKLNSTDNFTVSNSNLNKNDVGLFLFEYNVSIKSINDIEKKIVQQSKGIYGSADFCLLIVNRFETKRTKDSVEVVIIKDSSLIDKSCYNKLLPIPNFIDFSISAGRDFWMDKDFKIYVLNAISGKSHKRFLLQPNPQMPKEWENGFSKGIAINNVKNTVIYWSIIW